MTELWQATATLPRDTADSLAALLEGVALAVSLFEADRNGTTWRVEAIFEAKPDPRALSELPGGDRLEFAAVPARDWVTESQRALPPIRAGRFHLHGSHDPRHPLPNVIDLLVEAGQAFGTGRHETTKACLLMLDRELKRQPWPRRVLDLGCGSGVLALAFAAATRRAALGSDIDPVAVRVTRENARVNRQHHRVRAVAAAGFRHRTIGRGQPYDLIFANILARPLVLLAPAMGRHLAPGGRVLLSGLLRRQEAMVANAMRRAGLRLERRMALGEWSALLMRRG